MMNATVTATENTCSKHLNEGKEKGKKGEGGEKGSRGGKKGEEEEKEGVAWQSLGVERRPADDYGHRHR